MRNSKNLSLQPKVPDRRGHFGPYGGRYVAETLMPALTELEQAYAKARRDTAFRKEFHFYLTEYAGRETPLYFAERLSEKAGGAKIYLKREDLCHTGAHKINNTIGQILLARRMGKQRIIAETGAGQHGVATATVAARFGLQCEIFMGQEDVRRQSLNVFRMKLLGAKVRVVEAGSRTLKDAMNEALQRLGDQRAQHVLPDRLGRGTASLSDDGARFSIGHRPRSAPPDPPKRGKAAGLFGRLCRRRQQLDGAFLSVRARSQRQNARRRGGRPGPSHGQACGIDPGRDGGRAAWQQELRVAE